MIHNNGQIEQFIYDSLDGLFANGVISGSLYVEGCRPLDSVLEDAIIAISTTSADQIQEGRARLNIYVPDIDCGVGRPVKDKSRLDELSMLDNDIVSTLNAASTDYDFSLFRSTAQISDDNIHQHFVNINLQFKLITF